jgi:hypothetical protein
MSICTSDQYAKRELEYYTCNHHQEFCSSCRVFPHLFIVSLQAYWVDLEIPGTRQVTPEITVPRGAEAHSAS